MWLGFGGKQPGKAGGRGHKVAKLAFGGAGLGGKELGRAAGTGVAGTKLKLGAGRVAAGAGGPVAGAAGGRLPGRADSVVLGGGKLEGTGASGATGAWLGSGGAEPGSDLWHTRGLCDDLTRCQSSR